MELAELNDVHFETGRSIFDWMRRGVMALSEVQNRTYLVNLSFKEHSLAHRELSNFIYPALGVCTNDSHRQRL